MCTDKNYRLPKYINTRSDIMNSIKESLDKLIRGDSNRLDAYLLEVCKEEKIDTTKA